MYVCKVFFGLLKVVTFGVTFAVTSVAELRFSRIVVS